MARRNHTVGSETIEFKSHGLSCNKTLVDKSRNQKGGDIVDRTITNHTITSAIH